MPQLDLDHLFRAGESKSKVACETAAALSGAVQAGARAHDADAPSESVVLRVPEGFGLAQLFGAVLQRDGSTKGSSNPKAAAEATRKSVPRAGSRRLPAGKTGIVIGVLPTGKVVAKESRASGRIVARGWRRPAAGTRVFASEAVGSEPVSPKVSCFGAVRSERSAAANAQPEKEGEERSGCWASVSAALRGAWFYNGQREGELGASGSDPKASVPESPQAAIVSPPLPPALGLGDMKRLASRRWPENMVAEGRGSV